ncbi:nucleoporin NDC1 [Bacillus rossius redtenbacheri]|uniref:nucleoporin NDC1 n=1 Tax=Bacillus rossius redtenbacheri TaxID=93214 RepID=UPI002FDCC3D9
MERCKTSASIFKKRVFYSSLSVSVLQLCFLFVLLCLTHFDPWNPLEWLTSALVKFVSLRIWGCFAGIVCVTAVQCYSYSKNFVNESKFAVNRFAQLRTFFSLNYWLLLNLHMVVWGIMSWMIMELFEKNLIDAEDKCLSENRVVLLASGVWFGGYFLIFDCRNVQKPTPRYLQFPVIHQLKFLQVKMSLFPLFQRSVVDAVSLTLVFFAFYIWKGNTLREIVYEYGLANNEWCKDTSYSVLSISTILLTWFFSSIYFYTVYIMKLLFRVFLTEHHKFPVTAPFSSGSLLTIHEALLSSNPVIMQLGYLDLRVLAEKDLSRRSELFTLSHLGGHPHNWNAVVETALKMICEFTGRLRMAVSDEPKLVASACKTELKENNTKLEVGSPYRYTLRSLVTSGSEPTTLNPINMTVLAPVPEDTLLDIVARHVKGAFTQLLEKPVICYFFGDRMELNVHHVLSHAQPVMWAADGLSLLAASSIVTDKYGVALKDLPALITALLDLKQVLDRLHKMSTFKKELRSYQEDVKMRLSLQALVKRSLYRITIAFQHHINELPLSSGVKGQLKPFILFKEG